MKLALRVTYAVVQIGSITVRLACGTTRNTLRPASCAIAGVCRAAVPASATADWIRLRRVVMIAPPLSVGGEQLFIGGPRSAPGRPLAVTLLLKEVAAQRYFTGTSNGCSGQEGPIS